MALAEHDLTVHFLAALSNSFDLMQVASIDTTLGLHLLTHDVDLTTAKLVLGLNVTVPDESFIKLVFVSLNRCSVSAHLGR